MLLFLYFLIIPWNEIFLWDLPVKCKPGNLWFLQLWIWKLISVLLDTVFTSHSTLIFCNNLTGFEEASDKNLQKYYSLWYIVKTEIWNAEYWQAICFRRLMATNMFVFKLSFLFLLALIPDSDTYTDTQTKRVKMEITSQN